jgi:hypothetical protein
MINEQTIRKWWDIFVKDNTFTEVRILGRFQYSGYFNNVDSVINAIKPYSEMDDEQIYFVLNKIDNACYGRQQSEKLVKSPKITTNDNDIVRRSFVFVDFDPVRKSGTNASNEEFELAHKKAQDVFRFLRGKGFSEPIISKSGNGFHLTFKVDLPNDEKTTETIKQFYEYLASIFSDDKVDIDTKVFNLARLCKLYGTMAKKGANLEDRPWRMSEIIYVPKEINITGIDKFEAIAALLPPKETPKPVQRNTRIGYVEQFDLESWLNSHGVEYRKKQDGVSTKYEIKTCPWHETHSSNNPFSSALFQNAEGKITYTCAHSHCKDKQWKDFRLFYEPNAYDRPTFQPQYAPRQYAPQKKYEIKEEIPELGEKWLSMSSIQKVDLSKLEHYATGFTELDKNIIGLYMSEVTILSGSNASGKSSWLNTLLLNIIQQGAKVALWSGELRPDILKTWVQMVAAGKNNLRQSTYGDGKYYVPNNIAERIDQWLDGKFFLYNNDYGAKWQQIFHDMELLLKAGVKVFALDNLFSLDIDILDGDKNSKQRELILQIKDFAKKNQVHIILVAHPRKVTTFLRKNDISGTSDLQNAVDKIFIIHRVNNDFFRAGAEFFGQSEIQRFQGFGNVIEVCKERLYGVVDLMVGMQYEIESRRFKNDVNENVQYGWEIEPTQSTMTFDEPPNPPYNADWNYSNDETNNDMPFGPPSDDVAPF